MTKKISSFLLVVILILSTILSGCSSKTEAANTKGKVVVNFWTFWGSETRRPVIEKIVNDFNQSQDRIIVKHTFIPWGDIWTKNLAAVAAGNPADVVINDINSVAQRAENNQAEDLSKYIKADTFKKQFYPNLWDTVLYKGKPYAVPFTTDTRLLFYNKDAFKEAGLDPNAPPQTWEELEGYAQKLDRKQDGQYTRIGFYPLFGGFGAPSWLKNADNGKGYIENGQLKINTPNKVKALQWLADWQKHYGDKTIQKYQAEFSNGQANPFIAGKVAMYTDVATFYTQIRDSGTKMNFGVAPIPSFVRNSKHWSDGGGFVAEVPKGAKHPKEAVEFIKYLTSEKAQKYWAEKNYDNVANIKGAESALKDLTGDSKIVYQEAVNSLQYTTMSPVPIHYPDYQNRINPIIEAATQGKSSPENALENAEKGVEKMRK
ncbi:multiple sugar transport system substrate-binding protein [Bacillus sp. SORGH_AS 510]|uniref:ABC transporter substrate-binding protein n=1 Tax=Bacillus sp. SORGH_AS_0510 TaxID=3041771 RepID=UPI00278A5EB8|nr:ABC transporter substrate-binding protein [Bacillus sp. SORGH_AS_0510]MDQ1146575.1 multiple sugar transport system substrate-binding protein [Bacillus sp. SORGH_AS_0510]